MQLHPVLQDFFFPLCHGLAAQQSQTSFQALDASGNATQCMENEDFSPYQVLPLASWTSCYSTHKAGELMCPPPGIPTCQTLLPDLPCYTQGLRVVLAYQANVTPSLAHTYWFPTFSYLEPPHPQKTAGRSLDTARNASLRTASAPICSTKYFPWRP